MPQDELNNVRELTLKGLRDAQELLEKHGEQCDSSIVKRIIETISMAYSGLLSTKFNHKEDDERVVFLVEEMKHYLYQL